MTTPEERKAPRKVADLGNGLLKSTGPLHDTMRRIFYYVDQQTWCTWMESSLAPGTKFNIVRHNSKDEALAAFRALWATRAVPDDEEEVLATVVRHEIFPDEVEDWK